MTSPAPFPAAPVPQSVDKMRAADLDRVRLQADLRVLHLRRAEEQEIAAAIHADARLQAAHGQGYGEGYAQGWRANERSTWRWAAAAGLLVGLMFGVGAAVAQHSLVQALRALLGAPAAAMQTPAQHPGSPA